jgi:hypothetical protein
MYLPQKVLSHGALAATVSALLATSNSHMGRSHRGPLHVVVTTGAATVGSVSATTSIATTVVIVVVGHFD